MSEIVKPEPRTREWIESWRVALDATYMADNLPTRKAREEVHILCDMALNSLDLSTALENARKDALEEAQAECDKIIYKAKDLLNKARRRADFAIPGDIQDWENQAAGLDGLAAGALDCKTSIASLTPTEKAT